MAVDTERAAKEHRGLEPRQYVYIGLMLAVVTAVELVVSYSDFGALLIPTLIGLSAVKFAVVVAFFMHLKFEARILTMMFAGPLLLAGLLLIALITLFWTDITDIL